MKRQKSQSMKEVVQVLPILSMGLLQTLQQKYPELDLDNYFILNGKSRSNWEYCCLAVGAGLSMFDNEVFTGEHDLIEKQLKKIDPILIEYTNDFTEFITKSESFESSELLETQVAYWFISNYKQKKPTTKELQLAAPTLGRALIYTIRDIRLGKI